MRGFTLGLLGMAALLLITPMAAGATTPANNQWTFTVTTPAVPYGDPFFLTVDGPSNGSFAVNVSAPPFGHTYSLFYYAFTLPFSPNGTPTFLNVSIPTESLDLGIYQVEITNGTTEIGAAVVRTVIPGNVTQLQYNLTLDENTIRGLQHSVQSEVSLVTQYQTEVDLLVGVAIIGPIVSILIVSIRDREARDERFLQSWRAKWRYMMRRRAYVEYDDVGIIQEEKWVPDPNRLYRSGYCAKCSTVLWSKDEIVTHIKEEHPYQIGADQNGEPREGVDYYKDQKQVKELAEYMRTGPMARRQKKERNKSFKVDVDELLKGDN